MMKSFGNASMVAARMDNGNMGAPAAAPPRKRLRKPRAKRAEPLGSLHGNLGVLAYHVQRAVYASTMTVWADDRGDVYADVPSATVDVPAHWIAGTFGIGLPIEQIEEDLRELLRERAQSWAVD